MGDTGEFLLCPHCRCDKLFSCYGSVSRYREITQRWGSIQDYYQIRATQWDETGEVEEDEGLELADDPDETNPDIVEFLVCSHCDYTIPAADFEDDRENYSSDW
jgi:hypothetical protein